MYTCLISEANNAVRRRLLWVFHLTPLPRLNQLFFEWASGADDKLRNAAITALAQVTDDRLHELAKTKARLGELTGRNSRALDLFLHNYESGDASIITSALDTLHPNAEDSHSLALSLIQLSEEHGDPALAKALLWAYENTPCTICRESVLAQIVRFQQPDDILFECLHDSSDGVRAVAQAQSKTID